MLPIQEKLDEIRNQEVIAKVNLENANKALNEKCALENKHFSKLRHTIEYRNWAKCNSEIETLRKQREKLFYNHPLLVNIIKSNGVVASKTQTTAVKGYHSHTHGYKIYNDSPANISFYGVYTETFNKMVSDLEANGFKIKSKTMPERSLALGVTSSINIFPFYTENN